MKIRNIFTKLRLGCNRLKAYSHSENTDCDHCKAPETVSHNAIYVHFTKAQVRKG